jgi:hypothetical protein
MVDRVRAEQVKREVQRSIRQTRHRQHQTATMMASMAMRADCEGVPRIPLITVSLTHVLAIADVMKCKDRLLT